MCLFLKMMLKIIFFFVIYYFDLHITLNYFFWKESINPSYFLFYFLAFLKWGVIILFINICTQHIYSCIYTHLYICMHIIHMYTCIHIYITQYLRNIIYGTFGKLQYATWSRTATTTPTFTFLSLIWNRNKFIC